MGTFGEVAIVHKDEKYAQGAIDAAFQELQRVESLLTRFHPDLGGRPGQSLCVFLSSNRFRRNVQGVAVGPPLGQCDRGCLRSLPGPGDRPLGRGQPRSTARAVRMCIGSLDAGSSKPWSWGRVRDSDVVVFHEEDMGIDLGGIGKGYGVDRAVEALRSWGIHDGLVNVGGDLYALGVSEDGDPWNVGVRSPDDPDALIATLKMSDRAVATSGDYHQFFEYGGKRYHHLLDPDDGCTLRGSHPERDGRSGVLHWMPTREPQRFSWPRSRRPRSVIG